MSDDLSIPIEVGDPLLDELALRQRIADGIARRRQFAAQAGIDFDSLALGRRLHVPGETSALQDLQVYQDKIHVRVVVAPSPFARAGLLDRVVTRLKREFHSLAVYYCNLLGQRQILFNERLVRVLREFHYALESKEDLRNQIASLQERVNRLELQLQKRDEY